MSWIGNGSDRESILGAVPDIADGFGALYRSLWLQPYLPASVLELCRLRIAQLHRSDVELARRESDIAPARVAQLANWHSDAGFSAAERACLAFTEVYAMDAQAITDELAAGVKAHFGDAGLVLLVEALGIFDGMARLSLLWSLTPALSARETIGGRDA